MKSRLEKIPFRLRIQILNIFDFLSLPFLRIVCDRIDNVFKKYAVVRRRKGKGKKRREYRGEEFTKFILETYFGYFKADRFRKVFLIFRSFRVYYKDTVFRRKVFGRLLPSNGEELQYVDITFEKEGLRLEKDDKEERKEMLSKVKVNHLVLQFDFEVPSTLFKEVMKCFTGVRYMVSSDAFTEEHGLSNEFYENLDKYYTYAYFDPLILKSELKKMRNLKNLSMVVGEDFSQNVGFLEIPKTVRTLDVFGDIKEKSKIFVLEKNNLPHLQEFYISQKEHLCTTKELRYMTNLKRVDLDPRNFELIVYNNIIFPNLVRIEIYDIPTEFDFSKNFPCLSKLIDIELKKLKQIQFINEKLNIKTLECEICEDNMEIFNELIKNETIESLELKLPFVDKLFCTKESILQEFSKMKKLRYLILWTGYRSSKIKDEQISYTPLLDLVCSKEGNLFSLLIESQGFVGKKNLIDKFGDEFIAPLTKYYTKEEVNMSVKHIRIREINKCFLYLSYYGEKY